MIRNRVFLTFSLLFDGDHYNDFHVMFTVIRMREKIRGEFRFCIVLIVVTLSMCVVMCGVIRVKLSRVGHYGERFCVI